MSDQTGNPATVLARAGMVGVVLLCGSWASAASAADWYLTSSVTEEFMYENNFRLQSSGGDDIWGFNTRPRIGLETHAPRTDLYLNSAFNYGYFPNRTNENSFDQRGDARLTHRTERSEFGFGADVNHATTRTTEDDDTGRNYSDAEVIQLGGNASFSHSLTQLIGVGLRGGIDYTTYDTSALDDFRSYYGGPFVSYRLTERDTVSLNGNYRRFETLSGPDNKSNVYSGNVAWSRALHPQFNFSLSGGGSYVTTERDVVVGGTTTTVEDDRASFNAGASLTYIEERASITGSYAHAIVPSGNGRLQRRHSMTLSSSYRATPQISVGLSTGFIIQEAATSENEDRNFFRASPSLTYHFLPNWHARVAYTFRTQTLNDGDRSFSNGAIASVTWQLPSLGVAPSK